MYIVQCTVHSVQCTGYSVQCVVYSLQYTVYIVYCTVTVHVSVTYGELLVVTTQHGAVPEWTKSSFVSNGFKSGEYCRNNEKTVVNTNNSNWGNMLKLIVDFFLKNEHVAIQKEFLKKKKYLVTRIF